VVVLLLGVDASRNTLGFYHDYHPNTDLFVGAKKRSAMYPAVLTFCFGAETTCILVVLGSITAEGAATVGRIDSGCWDPCYFGSDADAGGHGAQYAFSDMWGATNTIEEARLEQARDAKGR